MSKINDGGPAHPVFDSNMGGDLMCTHSGMSLRAYIATEAMAALIPTRMKFTGMFGEGIRHDADTAEVRQFISQMAVAFADSLIAELAKETP